MPMVPVADDPTALSAGLGYEPQVENAPDPGDVLAAAFRQNNSVVSLVHSLANSGSFAPEPGYNPWPDIQNTKYGQLYSTRFVGSRSRAETESIKSRIDGEEADQKTLAAAGGAGVIAGMVAGAFDPTMALPGGMAVKAGQEGFAFGKAALSTAVAFGAQAVAQEAALQASQETRTPGESALNVASATILGGLIGPAAVAFMNPAERAAAIKGLTDARKAMDAHAAPPVSQEAVSAAPSAPMAAPLMPPAPEPAAAAATAAGAAVSDTREARLASFGLDKIPILNTAIEKLDPMSRLLGSDSVAARRAALDLAETPLLTADNVEGVPNRVGPALSRSAHLAIAQARVATSDELDRLFSEYRFGQPDVTFPRLRASKQDWLGQNEGKLTFDQFKAEVSTAMQEGDQHPIPQVAEAAQYLRHTVFDPWKQRAIDAGLLPEDVAPKGAESYLQRIYSRKAIAARRPEFVNRVTNWLTRDQAVKAGIKDRLEGLQGELEQTRAAIEKGGDGAAEAAVRHDELRGKIEEQIAAWEGKSVNEAKSAIKAREKYAAEARAEGKTPGGNGRLTGADAAVERAVKRILASDRDRPPQELRDLAQQITDRILGSPDGRLPYEFTSDGPVIGYMPGEPPRGPLAARRFAIPDAEIRDFLEHDVEHIVAAHLRTMVPDVLLTERFGDVALTETRRKIEDEFAKLVDGAKTEKARLKLQNQKDAVIRDLAAIRDRIRGVYAYTPEGPMRQAARISGAVKNFNVLTSMGMATISSLPDAAGAVFRHGLATTFSDAWMPWLRGMMAKDSAYKQAKAQFRAMGIATEATLATRTHAIADTLDAYKPQSRLERTLQWGADKFQLLNFLAPWTDWSKTTSSMVAGSEILRASEAVEKGTVTSRQMRSLAESNIDPTMARRIIAQFRKSGEVKDGVFLPNTADWTDAAARAAFEGAVARDADIAVVTPGQEKPLWLSTPVMSIFGQFKSFSAAATQRILIANLQRHDAQVLQGLMFSLGLGMVSYKINSLTGGQPTSDDPRDWIKEAMSRGNVLGWLEEGNSVTSKLTRGSVDIYRLIGSNKPVSKYVALSATDQLFGPTKGKLENLSKVISAGSSGDWTAADTTALRRVTAFQNLFYLRGLFNQVEEGANNAFHIPPKEQKRQ